MRYPKGIELTKIFLSSFDKNDNISIFNMDNPFHIQYNGIDYDIYIKCISYAGHPYPLDRTRAQLPMHQKFSSIVCNDNRFLFLGYDCVNDIFVCWNPIKAKERLNKKKYVSFFCRKPFQDSITCSKILSAYLSNDDKFVGFKRVDIPLFLTSIEEFFPELINYNQDIRDVNSINTIISPLIKQEIINDNKSVLETISKCINLYSSKYPQLTYSDWSKLVRNIKKSFLNE